MAYCQMQLWEIDQNQLRSGCFTQAMPANDFVGLDLTVLCQNARLLHGRCPGWQPHTCLNPAMAAAVPSSGRSPEGPHTSQGCLRPNMAPTYSVARSAWWSLCRCVRNTCIAGAVGAKGWKRPVHQLQESDVQREAECTECHITCDAIHAACQATE